ncbi:MAG: hypothetical protein LBK02_03760 [Treponema sp.]|jgi:hypothetical protein|nr:hypothetical protein [Treponema sp.]
MLKIKAVPGTFSAVYNCCMKNINKLKTFVGGVGEKITEKAGAVAAKAEYVLDVVRDKAGKAVGMVRDKAGNLMEIITENLPAVVKAVALSGLIAIAVGTGSIMVSCDLGTGNTPGGNEKGEDDEKEKGKEDEKDKEKDWKTPNAAHRVVSPVTAVRKIEENNTQLAVTLGITGTATSVAGEVDDMRWNIDIYDKARKNSNITKGMPSPEFLDKILDFNTYAFVQGHNTLKSAKYNNMNSFDFITDAITNLDGMVKDEDKELFKAYIKALRGVNFISARDQVNNDYDTSINLGNGSTTVGALLQNINNLNGEGTDYEMTGAYPASADLHAAASALLPNADNAYPGLIKDVITEMGNYEQLLGFLTRAYSFGKFDITFEQEAYSAISTATGGRAGSGIMIDKPEYYTQNQSQSMQMGQ